MLARLPRGWWCDARRAAGVPPILPPPLLHQTDHSDLPLLKQLIFSESSIIALKHQTENLFAMYRRRTSASAASVGRRMPTPFGLQGRAGLIGNLPPFQGRGGGSLLRIVFLMAAATLLMFSGRLLWRAVLPPSAPWEEVDLASAADTAEEAEPVRYVRFQDP